MTGTGLSGIAGGRMRAVGLAVSSPSSTHQRQNNRSDRKRVAAVEGLCMPSSRSRNISTCSRVMSATVTGRFWARRKSSKHLIPSRYPDTVFDDFPAARSDRAHDGTRD
jgi:hypothetical protein